MEIFSRETGPVIALTDMEYWMVLKPCMKGNGKMIFPMERVSISSMILQSMKGSFRMENLMEGESLPINSSATKESFKKECFKVREWFSTSRVRFLRESLSKTVCFKEFTNTQTETFMRGNMRITKNQEKVSIYLQTVTVTREVSRKERERGME
jgi:hypothetical protein